MSGDLILGCDPGKNGDFALLDVHGGGVVEILDVPTLQLKNKRELDEYAIARLMDEWSARIIEAWIEQAWPRPGEAATLSFQFGTVYGALRGAITANFIPLHTVAPTVWKKAMGVRADKEEARQAASIMWPTETGRWPNKGHHGRCEAALIAAYGRRQFLREFKPEAA